MSLVMWCYTLAHVAFYIYIIIVSWVSPYQIGIALPSTILSGIGIVFHVLLAIVAIGDDNQTNKDD